MEGAAAAVPLHQDGAIISPRLALGATVPAWSQNGVVLDGRRLLYPCGVFCALYSLQSLETLFVPAHECVRGIEGIALSKNRKYVACIEQVEGEAAQQVTVYSLQTLKRVKTLNAPGTGAEPPQIVGLSFSDDCKLLAVQHGAPDHSLVVWRWYSGKAQTGCNMATNAQHAPPPQVIASAKLDGEPLRTSFSPIDDHTLASVSATAGCLHRVDVNTGVITSVVVTSPDASAAAALPTVYGEFTNLAWLAGGLLAFTTSAGHVQINQDREIKGVLRAAEGDHLLAVAAHSRGLLAAGAKGVLYIFDPVDTAARKAGNKEPFRLVRQIAVRLPAPNMPSTLRLPRTAADLGFIERSGSGSVTGGSAVGGSGSGSASGNFLPRCAALEISCDPGEDSCAVRTAGGEVLMLNLAVSQEYAADESGSNHLQEESDCRPWEVVAGGFGRARVVGLDACSVQPLVLTAGEDRMIRLIHYEAQRSIVVKHMDDEVLCCALHPTGMQLLVGLHGGLRLFNIALDELVLRAELPVKRCNLVRYSNGGGVFAAVGRTNTIVVYHAYRAHQVGILKGHVSAVTSLAFSADDRMLVSTGAGGAVYFWDMANFSRIIEKEYVDKRSVYCSAVQTTRHTGAIARTHDGRIQHIKDGKVVHEVADCVGGQASPLVLIGDDAVLLAASSSGTVRAYSWPDRLPPPAGYCQPPPLEHRLHAEHGMGLSGLVVLQDRGLVFSAGADGSLLMSTVALVREGQLLEGAESAGAGPGGSQHVMYVTVPEDRLSSLQHKQQELLALVTATKAAAEYQVFRQTQALRDVMARLQDENTALKGSLVTSEAQVQTLMGNAADRERQVVKQLESSHMTAAEELESLYEQRLELERAKLQKMATAMDDMQFRFEEQGARAGVAHAEEVRAVEALHMERIEELKALVRSMSADKASLEVFHEAYADQLEVDIDENTDRLEKRMDSAAKAGESREQRLKADNNLLKRTCLRLKGDKAIEMKKMEKLMRDNGVLKESLTDQQITIGKLRHELEERDSVMADNYSTIQMLRRQGQELEKHKFVMGHKAESYQAQLHPTQQQAASLAAELAAHDKELVSELTRNNDLARGMADKEQAIRSLKGELADTKLCMKQQANTLRLFSFDLTQVINAPDGSARGGGASGGSVGSANEQRKLLKGMYTKYCVREEAPKSADEVEAELNRHLHMAELRSATLEHRLKDVVKVSSEKHKEEVSDNTMLLRELQVMQKDHRETVRRLEASQAELRDLSTRYKILEQRARTAGLGSAGASGSSDPPGMVAPGGEYSQGQVGGSGGDYYYTASSVSGGLNAMASPRDGGCGGYGGDGGGGYSMAGRAAPSRPSSGYPAPASGAYPAASSSYLAAAASSGASGSPRSSNAYAAYSPGRPGSAAAAASPHSNMSNRGGGGMGTPPCPASAAVGGGGNAAAAYQSPSGPERARNGGAPGSVARCSPARVLHELIGVERERVAYLMGEMAVSEAELERQRASARVAEQTIASALVAEADGEEEDVLAKLDGSEAAGDRAASWAVKRHGPSNMGPPPSRRPVSAVARPSSNAANAATQGPVAFGTPPKRRPTSAAGMGARVFLNSNVKAWKEQQQQGNAP